MAKELSTKKGPGRGGKREGSGRLPPATGNE
jgi:hypothetical protein